MPLKKASVWEDITVEDVVSNAFVEGLTLAAVFAFGAMVGSFVNVVLYRAPRRMNLFWPPSRCPHCGKRLKLFQNVPVLGWLSLRGKCKFCKAPIPKSYLRVEYGFGLLFLAVMYTIIHTGGWTLPLRTQETYFAALWTIWYPRPDILRIWGSFTLLAAALATLRLFVVRDERLPGHFVSVALLAGVLLPVWLPGVQQVPLAGGPATLWHSAGWVEAVVGLATGGLLGGVFSVSRPPRVPTGESRPWLPLPGRLDLPVAFALTGTWLGWQAVVSVSVLAAIAGVLLRRLSGVTLAAGAAAAHFLTWRLQADFAPWWPGPETVWWLYPVWAAVIVGGVLARRRLTPAIATPEPSPSEASPEAAAQIPERATPAADSPARS